MSGVHDLRQQLERLGQQPVEPARPEFRAALLARLLETDRPTAAPTGAGLRVVDGEADRATGRTASPAAALQAPAPVDELARRRRTRVLAQAAAAVSIAAAAAGVLGVVSLVDDGAPTAGLAGAGTQAELASGTNLTHVVIKPTGELVGEDGEAARMSDGAAQMTCDEAPGGGTMVFYDIAEQGYECPTGDVVTVEVRSDAIVSSDAPKTAMRHVDLELYKPAHAAGTSQPLTWSWERYSGRRFDHYELRAYVEGADPAAAQVVATIDDVNQTTFRESSVPQETSIYYVAVIAPDGSESGRSGEYRVKVKPS